MPSLRPCPSEPPGHLSGHPGLCSFCLCEHLCTHSSAPTHLPPWSDLGMVALPNLVWKGVRREGVGPPALSMLEPRYPMGNRQQARGGVDTSSKCA